MSKRKDADDLRDSQIFDTTGVDVQEWTSKDRTVATIRMKDEGGMNDMKIYLTLKERVEQYEIMLNIQPEHDGEH